VRVTNGQGAYHSLETRSLKRTFEKPHAAVGSAPNRFRRVETPQSLLKFHKKQPYTMTLRSITRSVLLSLLFLAFYGPATAFAQTETGQITGVVTEAGSDAPLPGVNVILPALSGEGVGAAARRTLLPSRLQ